MSTDQRVITKGELRKKLAKLIALAESTSASEGERENCYRAIGEIVVKYPSMRPRKQSKQISSALDSFANQFFASIGYGVEK